MKLILTKERNKCVTLLLPLCCLFTVGIIVANLGMGHENQTIAVKLIAHSEFVDYLVTEHLPFTDVV